MARDLIHFQVRKALEKEGWEITADPFYLSIDGVRLEIDLEAQRLIMASKGNEKIYIEIKTFKKTSNSTMLFMKHTVNMRFIEMLCRTRR